MIDPRQVRIGNHVIDTITGKVVSVTPADFALMKMRPKLTDPIDIIHRQLMGVGFLKDKNGYMYKDVWSPGNPAARFTIEWKEELGIMLTSRYQGRSDNLKMRHIKYMHQLENLSHSLSGQEMLFQKQIDGELRALSLKEPFASLMIHGKIETRTWKTDYRGYVLICSSKKPYTPNEVMDISGEPQYKRIREVLRFEGEDRMMETRGHAIAVGKLVDCRPMDPLDEDKCFVQYQEPWLVARKGKGLYPDAIPKQLWCHVYEDVRWIKPIPWVGTQGWKKLDPEFQEQIEYIS